MTLFPEIDPSTAPPPPAAPPAAPPLMEADRTQVFLRPLDLEGVLPADHPARTVWLCVSRLDLAPFYAPIASVDGAPGRPAIDPKILVTLWLYATSEGVGSARALARLCTAHDAYRWICGGVEVCYHTLSTFRVAHQAALDALLTETLAVLLHQGLVTLTGVAQDGTRVRADAGAASFRREKSLRQCLAAAAAQVERCAAEDDAAAAARSTRQAAAQARAARERQGRVEQALAELPAVRAAKKTAADRAEARVSTTDPEARVMKMADGGYRPAYNLQAATIPGSQVVVGVSVTNVGSDMAEAPPMVAAVHTRCGQVPPAWLMDGGFAQHDAITTVAAKGVTVYAPVPKARGATDPYAPHAGDSPAVAAWRTRMATPEAKAIYKDRAATAECVNALWKEHRGLQRLPVRGRAKVLTIALWHAVTHNLLRWIALEQAAAAGAPA